MLPVHRIRLAVRVRSIQKLSGEIEADETFIGGKARNMHITQGQKSLVDRVAPNTVSSSP